jgi:NADP-dependent 3-hydroxy acid dehydrogenase YdfG
MARRDGDPAYDPSTRIDPRSVARAVRLAADATDDAHIPDIIVRPRAETPR